MIVACKDYLNTHQNRNRGSNHRFFFGKNRQKIYVLSER